MNAAEQGGFWRDLTSIRWAGIDWVEELLYLSLAAMEAGVIYPWYLLFNALAQNRVHAISFLGMCALMWVPYLCASLLNRTALTADRRQAVVAGLMILTIVATLRLVLYGDYALGDLGWLVASTDRLFSAMVGLPPDLVVIGVLFVCWWRGIVLSRKGYDVRQVGFHFRVGIVVLLAYFLVAMLGQRENLIGAVAACFVFGLISIALARMLEVGGIHDSSLGSKQWVAVLIGSSLSSLGLALLLAALFSRQVLTALLNRLRPAIDFFRQIAWYGIGVLFYLFYPLLEWLVDLIHLVERNRSGQDETLFASPMFSPILDQGAEDFREWFSYCNSILIALALVGGLLLVARMIRRLMAEREKEDDLDRESVWSAQDLVDDLKNSLRQGLDNVRAWMSQLGDRKKRSAASIRKIYASMVDLAAEAGHPRRPATTPYEHRRTLYRAFPEGREAVDTITEAYVRVHYGEAPDSRKEMQQIVRCWEQVQRLVVGQDEPVE